ncbi:hypothetical protein [Ruegeria atlantica]|uniref:hypothetical protein n=1 Tax=Ruegeria atlantica TaxID=81569 RepID=UPI0024942C11|nr:hypothetical protein [Ruegeria atlantica]
MLEADNWGWFERVIPRLWEYSCTFDVISLIVLGWKCLTFGSELSDAICSILEVMVVD